MKTCRKCGCVKGLEDFHRLKSSSDGRQPRCKACVSAYMRDYHERNAAAINAKVRAWRKANPERAKALAAAHGRAHNARAKAARHAAKDALERTCRECGGEIAETKMLSASYCSQGCQERAGARRWRLDNPEARRAVDARYRATNPDSLRRKDQRRRALKRASFVEDVHPLVVLERDDGACGICGLDVDPCDFHVDHIVPLARGGEHSYANVQPAHPLCNVRKRDRLPSELEEAA